jgi:membrane protein YqaA with SNARE-associated domain
VPLFDFIGSTPRYRSGFAAALPHLGGLGLFLLAIVDSSPMPTFGGLDILMAILAARHREPWYYYAAAATAGSVVGAYITFRIARRAGSAYLHKFGHGRAPALRRYFERWGTGALVAFTAIPLPFPTSAFFAAAGVSGYPVRRYVAVVTLSRSVRYAAIAFIADHYGRHFITLLRHPDRYRGWLLLTAFLVACVIAVGILLNRKLNSLLRKG